VEEIMTREDVINCLPGTPFLPIIILCKTEQDINDVKEEIKASHGKRYLTDYDVRVVLNEEENRELMRSILCLAYLDTSCIVF